MVLTTIKSFDMLREMPEAATVTSTVINNVRSKHKISQGIMTEMSQAFSYGNPQKRF